MIVCERVIQKVLISNNPNIYRPPNRRCGMIVCERVIQKVLISYNPNIYRPPNRRCGLIVCERVIQKSLLQTTQTSIDHLIGDVV